MHVSGRKFDRGSDSRVSYGVSTSIGRLATIRRPVQHVADLTIFSCRTNFLAASHSPPRMGTTYFKRYRMDRSLADYERPPIVIDQPFDLLPWSDTLLRQHAVAKHDCFEHEIDAAVFPCLGKRRGCQKLMEDISRRSNFVPEATWLLIKRDSAGGVSHPIGTIQGLRDDENYGAIQNVGVVPEYRGLGLGSILLHQALDGFRSVGCPVAHLEVTVQNRSAIRLYERLGFRKTQTVFKVAEVPLTATV